jgi:7-carboxy-7-deazaguanine synthase
MFGKNPIRSATNNPDALAVEGMFYTLQGEGPYSGMPALFIRLAGCNLACHFCDTQFETQAEVLTSLPSIMEQVEAITTEKQRELVVLTGGEPLRQNCVRLIWSLLASGTKLVQIETAGTLWPEGLDQLVKDGHVVLVCSPKTPGLNIYVRELCHHWKYVIRAGETSDTDGLPIAGTQFSNQHLGQVLYRIRQNERPNDTIWVSPCDSYDPEQNQRNLGAARDAALKYGYRLSLQVHKIAGVE